MFIKTDSVITNLSGETMQHPKVADGKPVIGDDNKPVLMPMTLGHVIREALIADYDGPRPGPDEMLDRLELAERCVDGGMPVKISNAEAKSIQEFIAKRFPIMVASKAIRMIKEAPSSLPKAANGADAATESLSA